MTKTGPVEINYKFTLIDRTAQASLIGNNISRASCKDIADKITASIVKVEELKKSSSIYVADGTFLVECEMVSEFAVFVEQSLHFVNHVA